MDITKLRKRLKKSPLIYGCLYTYRNNLQNHQIRKEQQKYEKLAASVGTCLDEEPANLVFSRLSDRLARRSITWPPKVDSHRLHILYAGVPGNWERHNIPPELEKNWDTTVYFLQDQGIPLRGNWAETRREVDKKFPLFVEHLHKSKPIHMMLSYLSGAQVSPESILRIGELGIPTFSFHLDDRRSFRGVKYGNQWSGPIAVCGAYDLNLTNSLESLVKYRCEGGNVLFWPEGANPCFFRPMHVPFKYDVTFCGQKYGERPLLIRYLRKNGINVDCFGEDWEHGYQSESQMVRVFCESRISLGFGFVNESSDQCLKGRDFEVPSCGTVYLTSHNRNLSRVYHIGTEILTYKDYDDCLYQVKRLLNDPVQCDSIRRAARRSVVERHSWSARIVQLLSCGGVPDISDFPM